MNNYEKWDIWYDASFDYDSKTAAIAYVIVSDESILIKNGKLVKCKSSTEGEFLGLLWVLLYILAQLEKGILSQLPQVTIYGDNKSLIDCVNKQKSIRGIDKREMSFCLVCVKKLMQNNQINLIWTKRKLNGVAHKIARDIIKNPILCDVNTIKL